MWSRFGGTNGTGCATPLRSFRFRYLIWVGVEESVTGMNHRPFRHAPLVLALNWAALSFAAEDAIRAMFALAAGELEEDALAAWFGERIER